MLCDAYTTMAALKNGFSERNRIRRFLIRTVGLNGGTYGVALAFDVLIVAVNVLSKQPVWSLVMGNCIIIAVCWWAIYKNSEKI